jgi:hypothetical protein
MRVAALWALLILSALAMAAHAVATRFGWL